MMEDDFKQQQKKQKRTKGCSFVLDIVFKSGPCARRLFVSDGNEAKQIFVTLTLARHERQRQLSVDCCQLYFLKKKLLKISRKIKTYLTLIKHLFGDDS